METEDPRAALGAKDLPTQAAGARDLARVGTWDDVDDLLQLAVNHKRTGLRLIAAAAAADIVHRYRTGSAGEPLGTERANDLVDWVKRTDPGLNPSALMLLSAVPTKTVVSRLGRLLRDPRGDVRTGAAVAVRRMAVSHTDLELPHLREAVGTWLTDRRSPPDALAELVHLVGRLGWSELRPAVQNLRTTSEPVREAITQTLQQLDVRADPATWQGLWLSNGLDVLEQIADDPPTTWMLIGPDAVVTDGGQIASAEWQDDRLHSDALPGPARLAWLPRLGQPTPSAALQAPGQTWYRVEGTELMTWLDEHALNIPPAAAPAAASVAASLAEAEGAAAVRARAICQVIAGDLQGADEALTKLTGTKKPRADLFFWLGELRLRQGRSADAIAAFTTFVDRNPKRSPLLQPAQQRLAELEAS